MRINHNKRKIWTLDEVVEQERETCEVHDRGPLYKEKYHWVEHRYYATVSGLYTEEASSVGSLRGDGDTPEEAVRDLRMKSLGKTVFFGYKPRSERQTYEIEATIYDEE